MNDRLVFVPCEVPPGATGHACIQDADGWPLEIRAQPVGRIHGRLWLAARWLRTAGGRHRVQFADGREAWVCQGPVCEEDFVPLGWTI